jgi:hypothetical protein
VLLDTATGKTWLLHRSADGNAAWAPVRRLDTDKPARQWREAEKQRAAEALDEERAKVAVLQAEVEREAARRRAQPQERDQARRALEEAQRRLRELHKGLQPPPT